MRAGVHLDEICLALDNTQPVMCTKSRDFPPSLPNARNPGDGRGLGDAKVRYGTDSHAQLLFLPPPLSLQEGRGGAYSLSFVVRILRESVRLAYGGSLVGAVVDGAVHRRTLFLLGNLRCLQNSALDGFSMLARCQDWLSYGSF